MSGCGSSSTATAPLLSASGSHQSTVGQTGWPEAPHLPGPDLQIAGTYLRTPVMMHFIQYLIHTLINVYLLQQHTEGACEEFPGGLEPSADQA